ncbi:MAG: YsnF/AvaK domain-containing protein [Janthinobacterium lividum]
MTHTLVAAFDTLAEAQAAKSQLLIQHVLESDITLSSNESATSAGTTSGNPVAAPHHESFGEKVSHFFSSLFGNDEHDKPHRYAVAYPEAYRRGATLLTVNVSTDEQIDHITDVLERNGAIDIDERSASWNPQGSGFPAGNSGAETTHIAGTHLGTDRTEVVDRSIDSAAGGTAIPVIEEDLRVGKREVNTGRVRVVSRVTERPVEETVNLHEEHAHIERRPVDRPADASELNSFQAGSIEIQETAEEVVVEKSARVVEEVTVGKQSSDHQETVRDTVRRTDVDVQSEPGTASRHETLVQPSVDPLKNR